MADTAFHIEVVSADTRLYSGEATFVIAQTTEGELGVLANHEPLLGQLVEGGFVLIEEEGGQRKVAAVQGGFLSVTGETVTVLAESAEWADEVDADAERSVLESEEEGSERYIRAQSRLRAVEELGHVK
ncbi:MULTISPECIES: F0F1 ATP synthase subunit epsilon [Actinomycetes]|jgi:F-type H+-transporting ATPase subunit epsilon|uniref:ATP synthase epsilon chain n=1 Tax=Williamsia marianensis TaxID=85044 RepID=A0A315SAG5_WILMA|nr:MULTISPECIES: F0F1 ATP synthase subunit epsilon [Actinomycetes]ETD32604.1 F0F1 ATP synthase subunit epsilon [Williamsia sp. D3]MDV7133926.1 F0F1 ATP synthase subunit epsilon [Williamsia muralis]PVY31197.1 ATP synthase F1 subcomplex epsilon subunit [Williamsia marianensis]RKR95983.1 ATP synthase F1 subcomplex epsilon subunit [Williamsia muralis]